MQVVKKFISALLTLVLTLSHAPIGLAAVGDVEVGWYLHDHLGGIEKVLNEDFEVVADRDYLPYGITLEEAKKQFPEVYGELEITSSGAETYGFTGKELDKETDLHYFEARYYDSLAGKFTSIDPVVLDEGAVAFSKVLTDPQQLNHYQYAKNNPLTFVDENGEIAILPIAVFAVSFAAAFFGGYQNVAAPDINSPQIHTRTNAEIIASTVAGELAGATLGAGTGVALKFVPKSITSLGFKHVEELQLYRRLVDKGVGQNEAVGRAKNAIQDYLGDNVKIKANPKKPENKVFMSEDGSRKVRFDFNNSGTDKPHVHIEKTDSNGKWRDATGEHRIYPKD